MDVGCAGGSGGSGLSGGQTGRRTCDPPSSAPKRGPLSRLAPNCNFEVTFLPLTSNDGKESKSMRVSYFQASPLHLTWTGQTPVSPNRRGRPIREPVRWPLPLISSQKGPEDEPHWPCGHPHFAPPQVGGPCPASLCQLTLPSPCPSTCLQPRARPASPHLPALQLEQRSPCTGQLCAGRDTLHQSTDTRHLR